MQHGSDCRAIVPYRQPRRMAGDQFLLLALPDPCLLRVLQCFAADDQCSLFNAARAHSRLHQAAVLALHSITMYVAQQQDFEDVVGYLDKHGQHVNSLELHCHDDPSYGQVLIHQLPQQLQLSSLQLTFLSLGPGMGCRGVLGDAAALAALKQLRLDSCEVLDNEPHEALAAALAQLPAGLEHLSIINLYHYSYPRDPHDDRVRFPAGVLQRLDHLTHLELGSCVVAPDEAGPALQPLRALTGLLELNIDHLGEQEVITSSMLSGMQSLTRLEPSCNVALEPGALAGMTQLQHLCLKECVTTGGAAGVEQLLLRMQQMQQLTHLRMWGSLQAVEGSKPPAAAYAALTASSKLQHLDISRCTLPTGVWQHVFPVGRQLPELQSLIINNVMQPSGQNAEVPDGSRLVSCCPGLQSLEMGSLQCRAELLTSLQGLGSLHTLDCDWEGAAGDVVGAVCQLTGLRELRVHGPVWMKEEGTWFGNVFPGHHSQAN